jgi:hypothetical protein
LRDVRIKHGDFILEHIVDADHDVRAERLRSREAVRVLNCFFGSQLSRATGDQDVLLPADAVFSDNLYPRLPGEKPHPTSDLRVIDGPVSGFRLGSPHPG